METTHNSQPKWSSDDGPVSGEKGRSVRAVREEPELLEELETERENYLRLAAEYQNYRRRVKQENADAADRGKRELLMQLVSMADDLDLALAGLDRSPEAVADGLRMIDRRFRELLETNSVIAFESQGKKFDPEQHEAFSVAAAGEQEPGTVREEMRRGYFWKDKLFRPALVVVAQ